MKAGTMTLMLPEGVTSMQDFIFENPVNPIKNPTRMPGRLIPAKGMSPTLGFKCKKWGNGSMNDKRAHWRKGLGLGHGMVSTRYKAKVKDHV